jgi:NCS2 family nucleobase:cation symporter-2
MGWDIPSAIQPVLTSSLVLGTTTALALQVLFRIGQRKRVEIVIDPMAADENRQVFDFVDACGKSWGARHDVMDRVSFGLVQAIEVVRDVVASPGQLLYIEARFDEFNVDVQLRYQGALVPFPERRPSNVEIMETEDGHLQLAGFLMRRNADAVAARRNGGESVLQFHFDH